MHPLFDQLEAAFVRTQHNDLISTLNPPATEAAIEAAERAIAIALPPEIRALCLCHDGEDDLCYRSPSNTRPTLFPCGLVWLPLKRVVECWEMNRLFDDPTNRMGYSDTEPTDKVKAQLNSPNWIPIAEDLSGSQILIDLDPGPAGSIGQLICYRDVGPDREHLEAVSFEAYLQQLIYCIEHELIIVKDSLWHSRITGQVVYGLWQLLGRDWRPEIA